MSEHTKVIVGLKEECFKDKELAKNLLYYAGYGYEDGEIWRYAIKEKGNSYFQQNGGIITEENDNGSIYGINVVGTWHGAILLDDILELIEEAKALFEKITGQEGKTYIIGEQT